eukprot:420172_1
MKHENLVLDSFGYLKITDFGFTKKSNESNAKTLTFCGAPDYLSPQIIVGEGYGEPTDCKIFAAMEQDTLTIHLFFVSFFIYFPLLFLFELQCILAQEFSVRHPCTRVFSLYSSKKINCYQTRNTLKIISDFAVYTLL